MRVKTILFGFLLLGKAVFGEEICYYPRYFVSDYYCNDAVPRSRADNIPLTHVAYADDEYLTGYIQSLLDMHYYEFDVRVVVKCRIAYLFCLPVEEVLAQSIICFVYDVPCIQGVERVKGMVPDEISNTKGCKMLAYSSQKCARAPGIWLPQQTVLFQPLIADPRQVTNSAALRFNDDVIGKHVGAVSFGNEFGIYRWKDVLWWHGDMQFGVEAGIFSVFDLDHVEAAMVNTDFFVAAMLSYAFDRWSFRFRLWHLSSHIGDEYLICNPDFDRRNLSDEGVDFFASYQLCQPVRIYAGIGYIFDRDRSFPEDPLYLEWGTEVRVFGTRNCYDRLYMQPFLAMHFRTWEEHDYDVDQTYALGVEWSKIQGVGWKMRLFLEYHSGFSKEGQFVRNRADYFAIKVTYGF